MLVTQIANALKKDERFETLRLVSEGYTLTEIKDELGMSFAGVQAYYQDLEDVYLVEEVNDEKQITEAGELILAEFTQLEQKLQTVQKEMLLTKADQLAQEYEELGFDSDDFLQELESLIDTHDTDEA